MSIGFLTIYVLATAVGRMLNEASHRMRRLAGWPVVSGISFFLLDRFVQPANRRMVGMHGVDERQCNVAFVVLVMFVALVILCAAYGVNALYGSVHMPLILNAMNNHQLIVFLIVNVCKECSLGEPGNRPDQSLHENHVRKKRDRNAYPHTLHGCAQSDRLRRRCSDQKVNRFVDNKANGGTRTHNLWIRSPMRYPIAPRKQLSLPFYFPTSYPLV